MKRIILPIFVSLMVSLGAIVGYAIGISRIGITEDSSKSSYESINRDEDNGDNFEPMDTNGWATYKDSANGYSFLYPNSFDLIKNDKGLVLVSASENKDFAYSLSINLIFKDDIPELLSLRPKNILGKDVEVSNYSGGSVYYIRVNDDLFLQVFGADGSSTSKYLNDVFRTVFMSISVDLNQSPLTSEQ